MITRAEAKQATRQRLLATAKQEFIRTGYLNISTVDIARNAGVAHGTVFFHFQSKENLLVEVLDQELLHLTDELRRQLGELHGVESLLDHYLDFLEQEESFFAILARETPLYEASLRRTILGREAAVRMYFYNALEAAIEQGHYKSVDITTLLNFLFGTLNYYLSLRESFTDHNSVIAEKRQAITETFFQLITKQE
jgi:AcrR family transcriptional regulator